MAVLMCISRVFVMWVRASMAVHSCAGVPSTIAAAAGWGHSPRRTQFASRLHKIPIMMRNGSMTCIQYLETQDRINGLRERSAPT